jgi:hypothetical protein
LLVSLMWFAVEGYTFLTPGRQTLFLDFSDERLHDFYYPKVLLRGFATSVLILGLLLVSVSWAEIAQVSRKMYRATTLLVFSRLKCVVYVLFLLYLCLAGSSIIVPDAQVIGSLLYLIIIAVTFYLGQHNLLKVIPRALRVTNTTGKDGLNRTLCIIKRFARIMIAIVVFILVLAVAYTVLTIAMNWKEAPVIGGALCLPAVVAVLYHYGVFLALMAFTWYALLVLGPQRSPTPPSENVVVPSAPVDVFEVESPM